MEKIKNKDELEFAIFCIENVASYLGLSPRYVYDSITKQSNILNNYILPEYQALHTQSKDYIVEDIVDVMKENGVISFEGSEKL